jgi:hypothetical protein
MDKYINGRHISQGELEDMQLKRMQPYLETHCITSPKKIDNYWMGNYPDGTAQTIPSRAYKPPYPG